MIKKFLKYSVMTLFMFIVMVRGAGAANFTTVNSLDCDYKRFCRGGDPNYCTTEEGTCRFKDSNNNRIFCLNLGSGEIGSSTRRPFAFNTEFTYETTITGQGQACALVDEYKNGIKDYKNLNDETQITMQKSIWNYETYDKSCTNAIVDTEKLEEGSITLKSASKDMNLSDDGTLYISDKIIVTKTNISGDYTVSLIGDVPTGSYVSTTPGGVEVKTSSSSTLYVNVPVKNVINPIKLSLEISGSYQSKKNIWITPKIDIYVPVGNKINDQGQTYQNLGIISYDKGENYETGTAKGAINLSQKVGSLTIIKIDELNHNEVIAGTTFILLDEQGNPAKYIDGTEIGELVTDSQGKIIIDNLLYGKYKIKELVPAPGYIANSEVIEIEILDNNKTLKITNNPIKTKISKLDLSTGKKLTGAHIAIYDESNNLVYEFDSKKESEEIYLGPGKYILRETVAPNGYDRITRDFNFEVLKNGNIKLLNGNKLECDFSKLTQTIGDLNLDGNIDSIDASIISRLFTGWNLELGCQALLNADHNRDGKIDSIDVEYLQRKFSKWDIAPEILNSDFEYNMNDIYYDTNFKSNKNEIMLYNSPTVVDVPNTLKSSTIYAIIGAVLLLSGGSLIYLTIRKRKIRI